MSRETTGNTDEERGSTLGDIADETHGSDENPVIAKVEEKSTDSAIAVAGHPLHAMAVHFPIALMICTLGVDLIYWWGADPFWLRVGLWSSGGTFVAGAGAALVGTVELLAVPGIRARAASWAHGIAGMTLVAIAGANWGLRLADPQAVLPQGLALSVVGVLTTAIAGWHGGKLIFDHGIGLMVSPKD
ncbi:DUF2231 domain-containing protein [Paracoccus yeei]|uniref:DUF2231 domain-containing protein n=1 Tax=Paracoccus yeei TaxID=147645 RepID=UPI003BF7AFBB